MIETMYAALASARRRDPGHVAQRVFVVDVSGPQSQ